jgi:hypothetical protein
MSTTTYPRRYLSQYGVTDAHRFVCEWVGSQSAIVVGLGATEDEARSDALASASRGEYEISGGSLVVSEIEG